jgi:hypothetical protein
LFLDLARWIFLHRQQELCCRPLNGHEDERAVEPPFVIGIRVVLGILKRIAAHVRGQWRTQFDIRFAPYTKPLTAVLVERDLPIVIAGCDNLTGLTYYISSISGTKLAS